MEVTDNTVMTTVGYGSSSTTDDDSGIVSNCPTTIQQKHLVNGIELHSTQNGRGPHPILCIPGALAPCQWTFSSQLEYFGREGRGYTIVAYDPRGYGNSRPPDREYQMIPEHHLKADADDAYRLMKTLGYQQFSVLGWCDGGITAICLAAQFPDAIRNLVIWGSRTYLTKADVKLTEELEDLRRWNPRFREAFEAIYGEPNLFPLWQKFTDSVRATYAWTGGDVCTKEMTKVTCPTLILHGERDKFSLSSHAEYMKAHIAGSQLHTFADGRHDLQSCPGFNSAVDNFLKE